MGDPNIERLETENAKLKAERDDALRRALGHAYATQMAEGGEDIQHQELAFERKQHGQTLAQLRKFEVALTSIAKNTCCGPCQEAAHVATAALNEGDGST